MSKYKEAFPGWGLEAGREDMDTRPLWDTRSREDLGTTGPLFQLSFYR